MIEKPSFAETSPIPAKISQILHSKPIRLSASPQVCYLPQVRQSPLSFASQKNSKPLRMATEPTPKSQLSPSDRKLSRFIFKHLEKKLNFEQEHKFQSLNKSDIANQQPFASFEREYREKSSQRDRQEQLPLVFINDRRKNRTTSIRGDQLMKIQKKHKLRMKNCYRNSMIMNPGLKKSRSKHTHIDSYFDLSCLNNVKKDRIIGAKFNNQEYLYHEDQ